MAVQVHKPVNLIMTGPQPPEGMMWCSVCVMVFKALALERLQPKIEHLMKQAQAGLVTGEVEVRIDPDVVPEISLQVAVTRGPYFPMFNPSNPPLAQVALSMLDVCWGHATPVKLATGLMPYTPGDMPAGAPGLEPLGGRR